MEELKAMFRVCAHTKKDGARCNSPAMKGMYFCYQHIGGNIRELTRARSTYVGPRLDFVYPGDRQSIQHNFHVITQAMNDGKIDLQTYCAYSRTFSACERNLRRWETLYQKDSPEKELAPLPTDDEVQAALAQANNNAGGPTEPEGGPFKPGAPHLEEMWEQTPEQHDADSTPKPKLDQTWQQQSEDYFKIMARHKNRFLELERQYSHLPDYGDRVKAAIQEILARETPADPDRCPTTFPELAEGSRL